MFFKKRFNKKILFSKRITVLLKKGKVSQIRKKKKTHGNFFFKKFFFKTLLLCRKNLKGFFFLNKKTRQKEVTKFICKNQKNHIHENRLYEYTLLNILLRGQLCFFTNDALFFVKAGFVYVNGKTTTDIFSIIGVGDCIQIPVVEDYYFYIRKCKCFFKKKISTIKYNSWRFFMQKKGATAAQRLKKRKTPKYLYLFFLFRLGIPKILEIDYVTMSLFLLKKLSGFSQTSYYLNKLFSFKLFPLYNFKKIN